MTMTIEEKAQEYDAMVQRVKELHESGNALTKKQMEIICPELAESEDERIRKEIIKLVRDSMANGAPYKEIMLAWLERQKEPESVEDERIKTMKVFRPLAGTDIDTAAWQAIKCREKIGQDILLGFNGSFILITDTNTVKNTIKAYYLTFGE